MGIGAGVDLVEVIGAEQRVAGGAVAAPEGPALIAHEMIDDGDTDHVVERLQRSQDQRAMRPWARQRHVEMIAPRFGREAAFAARTRRAIGGDEIAEARDGALETAAGRGGVVPLVGPLAVDQQAHARAPVQFSEDRIGCGGAKRHHHRTQCHCHGRQRRAAMIAGLPLPEGQPVLRICRRRRRI